VRLLLLCREGNVCILFSVDMICMIFSEVRVVRSLFFCAVFCRSFFVLLTNSVNEKYKGVINVYKHPHIRVTTVLPKLMQPSMNGAFTVNNVLY
jgi:hypothetical protein